MRVRNWKMDQKKVREFESLIDSDVSENVLQRFLEENTEFLTPAYLLHHQVYANSFISKLPILNRITDFAFITRNSAESRLVLIELEKATKHIFKDSSKHVAFAATANDAVAQMQQWKEYWQDYRPEVVASLKPMIGNKRVINNRFTLRLILVIGRDSEFKAKDRQARLNKLVTLSEESGVTIMTYDTLLRAYQRGDGRKRAIVKIKGKKLFVKSSEGPPDHLFSGLDPANVSFGHGVREHLEMKHGFGFDNWSKKSVWVNARVATTPTKIGKEIFDDVVAQYNAYAKKVKRRDQKMR